LIIDFLYEFLYENCTIVFLLYLSIMYFCINAYVFCTKIVVFRLYDTRIFVFLYFLYKLSLVLQYNKNVVFLQLFVQKTSFCTKKYKTSFVFLGCSVMYEEVIKLVSQEEFEKCMKCEHKSLNRKNMYIVYQYIIKQMPKLDSNYKLDSCSHDSYVCFLTKE